MNIRLHASVLAFTAGIALPPVAAADAAQLKTRYQQLQTQLKDNAYDHELYIDSSEEGDQLRGEVYAVLDHPYAAVREALKEPQAWCDVLILPFNTKYCHAVTAGGSPRLVMRVGRKYDQPIKNAYKLNFTWTPVANTPTYYETRMTSADGPLGTRDYRIVIEVVPLDDKRSFMHLNYSYGYGMAGRMAMQGYLATIGADKVGFTNVGGGTGAGAKLIGGVRGAVERNAMRYYLAIDAYLDSLAAPPEERAERRIQRWFTESERFPRQLREMNRQTYVAMKRMEVERQKTPIE